ncbi:DNA-directed RNA polymerase III subunit RPC5-like [Trifolium medium]|uniref:DNA-directed RNA polymerase III subunit RPC5-like n=1 Tax=Trifolium medium TaxID=97028 RepID=A0A392PKN9_9FABA|nr:DNA-directed RNA polymerase III subunit RPC5-like [Trifolium medium]
MLPKGGSKIDVDAANSLDVPQDELKAVLGEVACDIHGCFVLKSSKDDLFRDVVIDMLRGSGPNGKLRKAEILEAARRKLGRDVPNNEYIKVSFLLV